MATVYFGISKGKSLDTDVTISSSTTGKVAQLIIDTTGIDGITQLSDMIHGIKEAVEKGTWPPTT
jgi:hypothetical protein